MDDSLPVADLLPDVPRPDRRYDVTITVRREASTPDPAAYAQAADKAAGRLAVSGVLSAHTCEQVITVVTVAARDGDEAARTARAVVAEALGADAEPSGVAVARSATVLLVMPEVLAGADGAETGG